ncbi:hypothetical protein [Novosphingobium sp.]|uniref:hypothetical protein n=1 Tax=Novosphingobium sp. TaxID=1874826 RepID=UPI00333F4EE7
MARPKKKAFGERGSWFATVDGERLPCVHFHWIKGLHHCDPGYIDGVAPWPKFVDAIRQMRKVIVTKDKPIREQDGKSGLQFERIGYIAVFSVDNIQTDEEGLKFELKDRLYDLQG